MLLALLAGGGPASAYDIGAWLDAAFAHGVPERHVPKGTVRAEVLAEGLSDPVAILARPDGSIAVVQGGGAIRWFGADPHEERLPLPRGLRLLNAAETPDGDLLVTARAADRLVLWRMRGSSASLLFSAAAAYPTAPVGGALAIDRDGSILLGVGASMVGATGVDTGRVLRFNPAGTSFSVFTTGHRDPTGIAVGADGTWMVERGPNWRDAPGGGDELNRLVQGADYGWPRVHHRRTAPGTTAPVLQFTPPIGPAGIVVYDGKAFTAWRGDLLIAMRRGRGLLHLVRDGERIVARERLIWAHYGELSAVAEAPDGSLLVTTGNSAPGADLTDADQTEGGDKLIRLVPGEPRTAAAGERR